MRDQQEILQLASVAPMVLDTALKETWGEQEDQEPHQVYPEPYEAGSFRIEAGNAVLTI